MFSFFVQAFLHQQYTLAINTECSILQCFSINTFRKILLGENHYITLSLKEIHFKFNKFWNGVIKFLDHNIHKKTEKG